MDVVNAMRVFIQVAEAGTFTRAAEQLGLSVPHVTRVVGQLEERLNVRLFQRTTRRISLTEGGATYLEGCQRTLDMIDETESRVVSLNNDLTGRLRVMCGSAIAISHMVPVISDFTSRYPAIRLTFFTIDNAFSLVDEAVDVAVLANYLIPSESVVARRLITHSYVIAAAPKYLSARGPIAKPSDLKNLYFLGRPADQRGTTLHLREASEAEEVVVDLTPNVICNNAQMLQEFTLAGCGFALLPYRFAQTAIGNGSLVHLLPDHQVQDHDVDVCLVYQSRKRNSRVASAFIDHVASWFASPTKLLQE
jgi:DNA-binding transcriptional LysR family regulator